MPVYIYAHPTTGQEKEVVQRMTETHVYFEDGVEWKRVFQSANSNVIGTIDPFSKKDFMRKTENIRGGNIGNLWDISSELSKKREKVLGKDPLKEKAIKDYRKKTGGKKHPEE